MTVAGYPRYESYKDSGVEWIGEIPTSWKQVANKYLFRVRKEQVGKRSSEYDLLSLTLRGIIKRNMENPEGKFPAEFDTYQEVRPGDFVFCQFDVEETPRAVGLSSFHGMITGAYTVYELESTADKGFFYYFYLNADNGKKLRALYKGLRNTIPKDSFAALKTPFPSLTEQRAIAAFLDEKCAKIDEAIRIKEEQIKLLHERRQILIQQAVTRGLNPDVPMKDSGIDWIGQIPAHWEVKKLKYLSSLIQTGPFGAELHAHDYVENQIPLINPKHMRDGVLVPEPSCTVCPDTAARLSKYTLNENDIVFARRGELGRCAVVCSDEQGWICGTGSMMFRPTSQLLPVFLYYVFSQQKAKDILSLNSVGSTMDNLNTSILGDFIMIAPPFLEQEKVVANIEINDQKIRNIVKTKQQQITALKEYKTTLINAAVTGKIRITPDILPITAE